MRSQGWLSGPRDPLGTILHDPEEKEKYNGREMARGCFVGKTPHSMCVGDTSV